MSLEETKEKLEWHKHEFECEQKITHGIENQNYITRIHDNEVNKTAECNLLHDIINPPKRTKYLNSHNSTTLRGCINTRHGRAKFTNFWIILDSGFSFTVVMGRFVKNVHPEKYSAMRWHTQAWNITTNHKVKVYFSLPALSATNVVTWKCHVDDSNKGRCGAIFEQNLLTELGLS